MYYLFRWYGTGLLVLGDPSMDTISSDSKKGVLSCLIELSQ